jgi:DNA-directed RNA polymerase sigma subunit (sigma70/sigma32)
LDAAAIRQRQKRIVARRKMEATLATIGAEFGLSRERVRQIVRQANLGDAPARERSPSVATH